MADAAPARAAAAAPRPEGYERIAAVYDADMGRSMAFDDVGFYAGVCAAHPGRVLELGCGNGRILLELVARGHDAVGVDGAAAMLAGLAAKARARGLAARVARMDVRRLAFAGAFAVVLCPYSLVTYMRGQGDAAALANAVRDALAPGGVAVFDAFVPRPFATDGAFRVDYRRPLGDATLVREKRIARLEGGVNRIERRYRIEGADGALREAFETAEEIREFAPAALRALAEAARFDVIATAWDYGATADPARAQFCTVVARRRG